MIVVGNSLYRSNIRSKYKKSARAAMTKCQIHVWAWNEANTPFRSIFFNNIRLNRHKQTYETHNNQPNKSQWCNGSDEMSGKELLCGKIERKSIYRIPLVSGIPLTWANSARARTHQSHALDLSSSASTFLVIRCHFNFKLSWTTMFFTVSMTAKVLQFSRI